MIYIELIGMDTATGCGVSVKARGAASPIPKLARTLIADGHAAHDIAVIRRGEVVCFEPAPLSWWAGRDVSEGDGFSVRFVKHRPFDRDTWG